jgi:hypothetical protein
MCAAATIGCKRPDPGPALQVLGESTRLRSDDPIPAQSPFFDGQRVAVRAARNETIGLTVWHRDTLPVTIAVPGARVTSYATVAYNVVRPSTKLYGGSHGAGMYPDGLVETAAPTSNPAYFEITATDSAKGTLKVGDRAFPVELTVEPVWLNPRPPRVWAYYDAKVLGGTNDAPSDDERACIGVFRENGILLSPDLPPSAYAARKELLSDSHYIPAVIPTDPTTVGPVVRAWIEQTRGTGKIPFAIPIDEPHDDAARNRVHTLADAVQNAGGGAATFLYAVTASPLPDFGGSVDVFISLEAKPGQWTYNGAPPRAGSMVLDAESPGMRTWGWIAFRYEVPLWYVWDALYWRDKHNKRTTPLDATRDATSFDDGEDHGNLDGVLAMPGCQRTLRLAQLRRGIEDRALLDLATACKPDETAALAKQMIPRALGDASSGEASWPRDEAAWEAARQKLLDLAAGCAR